MSNSTITRRLSCVLFFILFVCVFLQSELFIDKENHIKNHICVIGVLLVLLYCCLCNVRLTDLVTQIATPRFYMMIVCLCVLLSIYGLFQYCGILPSNNYLFPITGTYENPAGYVAVQSLLLPYAITLCADRSVVPLRRLIACVACVVSVIAIVLSGSRTGFLAVCVVFFVFLLLNSKIKRWLFEHWYLWLLILFCAVLLLFFIYQIKPDSANGRILIWRVCWNMIIKKPFFGYGFGNFNKFYMDAQASYFAANFESSHAFLADNISHPFNEFIKLSVELGLVGLLLSLIVLVYIFSVLLKVSDYRCKYIGILDVSSVLVLCQFSYPLHYSAVWLIVIISILPCFINSNGNRRKSCSKFSTLFRICTAIILVSILMLAFKRMYLDIKWTIISKRSHSGYTEIMLPFYERVKPFMEYQPLFLYDYASECNYNGNYEKSLDLTYECMKRYNDYDVQMLLARNLSAMNLNSEALAVYRHASNMIPNRFESFDGMLGQYLVLEDTLSAKVIASQILNKQVKIPSQRVEDIILRATEVMSYK